MGGYVIPKCPKCGLETKPYYDFSSNKLKGYDCHNCGINDVENYIYTGVDAAVKVAGKTVSYDLNVPIQEVNVNPHLIDRIKVKLSDGGLDITNYVTIDQAENIDDVANVYIDFDKDTILLEDGFNRVVFSGQISSMSSIDPAAIALNQASLPTVFQIDRKVDNTIMFCYYNKKHVIKLMEYYI